MKITEDCIDFNVTRLIDKELGSPWEYADQAEDSDHCRIVMLGYIRGMLDFAACMKEVLRS